MSTPLDSTRPVRPGEELPVGLLQSYLHAHMPDCSGLLIVEQFPSGHSNLTYLLRLGDRDFVLRRPPFGNQVKSAHDMGREYRVLSKLCQVYAAAPRPYLFCEDELIPGAPFYVMERRRGVVLRRPDIPLDPATAHRLSTSLIDNLALLHSLDYKAAGLGDLGKPEGYVTRQVTGWIDRYAKSRTEDVPAMEQVGKWLSENIPTESGAALIHNDFKYDNLLLDSVDLTRVAAVLDWEMATVGDPLMDLGSTLGYWVEAGDSDAMRAGAMGPTAVLGSLTRRELLERYAEKTERSVGPSLFYYCYGLFKLAVIVQQIYARYVRGHTRDERFARMNERVQAMSDQAVGVLAKGTI